MLFSTNITDCLGNSCFILGKSMIGIPRLFSVDLKKIV